LGLFLIGVKRDRLPILKLLFFNYLLLLLTSCKEGGWQSIRHNKHKIFYEGITGSVTIISRLIASEFKNIDLQKICQMALKPFGINNYLDLLFIQMIDAFILSLFS